MLYQGIKPRSFRVKALTVELSPPASVRVTRTIYHTSRTCGNSTACVCYLNWKPVEPPPQQTDGPVGKAGLELQTL